MVEEEGAGFQDGGAGVEVDVFAHAAAHVIVGEPNMGVVAGGVWNAAGHCGETVFAVVGVSPEAILREVSVKVIEEVFHGRAGGSAAGFGAALTSISRGGDGDGLEVRVGVGGVLWLGFEVVFIHPVVLREGRAVHFDLRVVGDAADREPCRGVAFFVLIEVVGGVGERGGVDGLGGAVADGVEGVAERPSWKDGDEV